MMEAHVYFIVEKPLSKKSGLSSANQSLAGNVTEMSTIEVKSEGKHGIMIVSPSIHKVGYLYEIIGTRKPAILDEKQSEILEQSMNGIYNKYSVNIDPQDHNVPISNLFEEDFVVYEGNNRHLHLLRCCESIYSRSNKILTFDELFARASSWNTKHCKPPLVEKEVINIVKQSITWINKKNPSLKSRLPESENIIKKQDEEVNNSYIDRNELLERLPNKKLVEYIIETAQKTVKQENSLVRLILYAGLSTYTNDPLNLGIMAPTSEGKTYAVNEVIKFLPKQDVWLIGSMSPKVLVRDKGVLVDENYIPIVSKMLELRTKIKNEKDEEQKFELNKQLETVTKSSKILIDLTNKILVFLEPPIKRHGIY